MAKAKLSLLGGEQPKIMHQKPLLSVSMTVRWVGIIEFYFFKKVLGYNFISKVMLNATHNVLAAIREPPCVETDQPRCTLYQNETTNPNHTFSILMFITAELFFSNGSRTVL